MLDSIMKFLRKERTWTSFWRGERGFCTSGKFSFLALEDSVPYDLGDHSRGEYLSMVVMNETNGEILRMDGFPAVLLEKLS